jgi:hypothetical protein
MIPDRNASNKRVSVRDHENLAAPGQRQPRAALSQHPYHNRGSLLAKRRVIRLRALSGIAIERGRRVIDHTANGDCGTGWDEQVTY